MNLEKCYFEVFKDIIQNGPELFKGIYDARNGKEEFMYGISTVMEYIAYEADSSEELYNKFSDSFINNMISCEEGDKMSVWSDWKHLDKSKYSEEELEELEREYEEDMRRECQE